MNLVEFLKSKQENGESYRVIADTAHVSHSVIERIINGKLQGYPEVETLLGIADGYKIPVWEVMRMAGIDLGLPNETEVARLIAYAEKIPVLRSFLDELLSLSPSRQRDAIRYIRALLKGLDENNDTDQPSPDA